MAIDVPKVVQDMLQAAKGVLQKEWPEIKDLAETEFKKIAQNFVKIERMKLEGKMDEERERFHLDVQKNAARTVLLMVKGLGITEVENAINEALNAVKDAINSALGWELL